MHRRNFLKKTLGSTVALAAANLSSLTFAGEASESKQASRPAPQAGTSNSKLHGVNLGGWLVLEKWMVPDVYRGTDAEDEYSLCQDLGTKAKKRLDHHRETFITDKDFRWIKDCGLNTVRLPVGYWAIEAPRPFVECQRFIDFALDESQNNGLKLLLDLHGAPGSQNGWDHSGRRGPINWPKDSKNIQETLQVLENFAEKYGQHPALFGIELLNEPSAQIPIEILQKFYQDAYARIRKHVNAKVAVVFHDSFRPLAWKNFMQKPAFTNVILDTHLYQCFSDSDRDRTAIEQLEYALNRKQMLDEMQTEELPAIVGEWSLALPGTVMRGLSPLQVASLKSGYANAQLLNYEGTRGWFFWSYKLEQPSEWNFRHCVESGWLPECFPV